MRRMKATSIYVSNGLSAHAYCGLETAFLVVIGKRHKLPVWQILGGKYRDKVRVYADCHGGEALESIDCMLVPRRPHWAGPAESDHKAVVSLKHHGWDASAAVEEMTPEGYAGRAQAMADRGFDIVKFDVDVPTAFFLTAVQIPEATTVGEFPAPGGDEWGALLKKDSPLTGCVSADVEELDSSGELAEIEKRWMSDVTDAPVLE